MIKKDDVMELHENIAKLKERQKKAAALAKALIMEIEYIDMYIDSIELEYMDLKRKAD